MDSVKPTMKADQCQSITATNYHLNVNNQHVIDIGQEVTLITKEIENSRILILFGQGIEIFTGQCHFHRIGVISHPKIYQPLTS
jgi:hypothetical protein